MIAALAGALALAAAADPCAPVEPAAVVEPATAAAYRRVGDAERGAGSAETAAVAYRAAVALDPTDAASRAALDGLCRAAVRGRDPFSDGLRRMEAKDLRGAAAAFRAARPDPSAALLEGVCLYELGEDDEAGPPLREAEAAAAHREAARFYLGLLALRRGDGGEAASLLDGAAASPAFGPLAADLARDARREGRLVLALVAESGWDSNPGLSPGGSLGGSGDGVWNVSASGLYRPWGESGPYLRASGLQRQQLQLRALDVGGGSAGAGWQLGRAGRALLAEYGYDYRALDGAPYLSAHRLAASAWAAAGDWVAGASYLIRLESYRPATYEPFSGTWQRAEARISRALGPAARAGLAWRVGADAVRRSALSWVEQGPRADALIRWGPHFQAGLEVGATFRTYRAADPLLGLRRADTSVDAAALAQLDLSDRWTARLSLAARRAFSNAAAFDYVQVVPALGIAYVMGL